MQGSAPLFQVLVSAKLSGKADLVSYRYLSLEEAQLYFH